MLEYCEEPYLCRRMMQLLYLGEDFDASECNEMCDNCRTQLQPTHRDVTEEAQRLIECIENITSNRGKVTLTKLVELAKGSTPTSVWLFKELIERHKGFLRSMN